MTVSVAILIFFSALGLLTAVYFLNFRRKTRIMGPRSLRVALSRTVTGGEEGAASGELAEGLETLKRRLRAATSLCGAALLAILAACIVLTALSSSPELVLSLCGVCIFLAGVIVSLYLLRDILHLLEDHLREES